MGLLLDKLSYLGINDCPRGGGKNEKNLIDEESDNENDYMQENSENERWDTKRTYSRPTWLKVIEEEQDIEETADNNKHSCDLEMVEQEVVNEVADDDRIGLIGDGTFGINLLFDNATCSDPALETKHNDHQIEADEVKVNGVLHYHDRDGEMTTCYDAACVEPLQVIVHVSNLYR